MSILRIEGPTFYSSGDESNFFSWIESLDCIHSIRGEEQVLIVEVGVVSGDALRELLAIYARYDLTDWTTLAQFENESNTRWFRSPESYWYDQVFGAGCSHAP